MDFDIVYHPAVASVIVLVCLALSAFFSGSETAMTAASRARMLQLEKNGSHRAGLVNAMLQARERLIGATLIGNNIVNIGASAFTTSVLVALVGDVGVLYATAIMSVLVIIFSEVLPKTYAVMFPDRTALVAAPLLRVFVRVLGPGIIAVEAIVGLILRLFGVRREDGSISSRQELRGQVDLMHHEGEVVKSDRDMLGGLLDLQELEVSDVMVHRTRMRTISADQGAEAIVREVLASPYTRMPLWRGSPENIVGVLHAKDLLRALDAVGGEASKLDMQQIALEAWFVPDTTSVPEQLKAFLHKKTHFALVVDEYGVVMGLVTLEDILEEIVGDIKDEHDVAVQGVRTQPDGSVIVEGSVPIRDLNRARDWSLPDEEATTIAGLVIHEARTIPDAGQVFTFHGFRFQVLRKSRNRVTALKITPLAKRPASQAA